MSKLKLFSAGLAQIPVLLGLGLMLLAIPFVQKSAQQIQDNRSSAIRPVVTARPPTSRPAATSRPVGCVPNGCGANTCQGSSCYDGCGHSQSGTKNCAAPTCVKNNCGAATCRGRVCNDGCGGTQTGYKEDGNCAVAPVIPPSTTTKTCAKRIWTSTCSFYTRICATTNVTVPINEACPADMCSGNEGNSPNCGYVGSPTTPPSSSCTDGARQCANNDSYRYCSGGQWSSSQGCGAGKVCRSGNCENYASNPTGAPPVATPTNAPPSSAPNSCAGSCVSGASCAGLGRIPVSGNCAVAGQVCCSGVVIPTTAVVNDNCTPGSRKCVGVGTVSTCNIDRFWGPASSCFSGYSCSGGNCIAPANQTPTTRLTPVPTKIPATPTPGGICQGRNCSVVKCPAGLTTTGVSEKGVPTCSSTCESGYVASNTVVVSGKSYTNCIFVSNTCSLIPGTPNACGNCKYGYTVGLNTTCNDTPVSSGRCSIIPGAPDYCGKTCQGGVSYTNTYFTFGVANIDAFCGVESKIKDGETCDNSGVVAKSCANCLNQKSYQLGILRKCGVQPTLELNKPCDLLLKSNASNNSCELCPGGKWYKVGTVVSCGEKPPSSIPVGMDCNPLLPSNIDSNSCQLCPGGISHRDPYSLRTQCGPAGTGLADGATCSIIEAAGDSCSKCASKKSYTASYTLVGIYQAVVPVANKKCGTGVNAPAPTVAAPTIKPTITLTIPSTAPNTCVQNGNECISGMACNLLNRKTGTGSCPSSTVNGQYVGSNCCSKQPIAGVTVVSTPISCTPGFSCQYGLSSCGMIRGGMGTPNGSRCGVNSAGLCCKQDPNFPTAMPTNAAAVPTNPANWCGGGGRLESCYNIESCLKVTGKEGIFMSGNGYCTTGKCCAPDPSKVDITRTPTLAPGSCRPAGFVAQCGSVGCCGGTYESIVSGPLCQCKSMPVNAPTRVAAPPQVPAPTTKPPVAVTTQPPAAPPVGGGGSNPGGGNSQPPAGVACREMTVRMQNSGSDPLVLSKAMKVNEIMDFVCIRPGDASGVLASTQFVVLGPNGYRTVLAGGKATNWKPTVAGAYTVYCEDLTANCTANRSIETGTINVAGSTATATCKECGSEFKCYGHPTAGYKWFTASYAETGYSLSSDSYCEQDNIAKPNWIGKANGDANCDGRVDVTDVSIWRSEYVESRKNNDPVKSTWESDFTGPDGKCDGKVTVEDRSLWRSVYIKSR